MGKVLVLLDYIQKEYVEVDKQGKIKLKLFNTGYGKTLLKILTSKNGMGIPNEDIDLKFFYKNIPPYDRFTRSYKPISRTNLNKAKDNYIKYINETKPKLVIGFGAQVCNTLFENQDTYELSDNTFGDYTCKTCSLPHLKFYKQFNTNEGNAILSNTRFVKRYLSGDKELKPLLGKYELITDFDKAKYIFDDVLKRYKVIACDFETNTLKTWLDGAKVLCISLSWEEGQGVTIPIDHEKCQCWNKEQRNYIVNSIVNLLSNTSQYKVFHNAKFDIRMCMDLLGLKHAHNILDTMMMYYIGYNELPVISKGLKHLARIYTDLGDYEKPRDEYFENMLKEDYDNWVKEQEEKGIKPLKKNYIPPTNKVDGSDTDFSWLPMEIIYPYASADTDATLRLYHIFDKRIKKNKRWVNLIYNYYPKVTNVLCKMEHTGMYLNPDKVKQYKEKYDTLFNDVVEKINAVTPEIEEYNKKNLTLLEKRSNILSTTKPKDRTQEQKDFIKEVGKLMGKDSKGNPKYQFNIGSRENLAYLFIELRQYDLPLNKDFLTPKAMKARKANKPETLTYKDYKMDRNVLKYIYKQYGDETANLLLTYSDLKKAKTTYVDALPELAYKNLIHAKFNMSSTATGRLSSSNPNLQNQSKPTHNTNDPTYGYGIKGMYTSRFKDGLLINFDYKSLEIFIAALFSKDKNMTKALANGLDIHKQNASIAFGVPYDNVTGEQRFKAKKVSFGLLYGMSTKTFAEDWNETEEEAQKTVDKVLGAMPGVGKAIKLANAFCELYGYVQTLGGNYRRLPDAMNKKNRIAYERAIRQCFNAIIQGSGPIFTNTSLYLVNDYLEEHHLKSVIVATVHDSILLDVHPDEVEEVAKMTKHIMENLPLDILKVKYSDFGLTPNDIPSKYNIDGTYFRFPMFAEYEAGAQYGDELELNFDELHSYGTLHDYCRVYKREEYINDKYDTLLNETSDNDKKDEIQEERKKAVEEFEEWKETQKVIK